MLPRTLGLAALASSVLASAAAFLVPLPPQGAEQKPSILQELPGSSGPATARTRIQVGKGLLLDSRLGHASLATGESGETYLFAHVSGADSPSARRAPPMNIALVIDRSGSMRGERIANAIAGALGTVERMRDGDSVTVVTFDTQAQVIVAPTKLTPDERPRIASRINQIRLGGDTCISCGLEAAMRELSQTRLGEGQVNRMLLLSDGAANHGVRDVPGLRSVSARMRGQGVSISTIGVDVDFDEKIMDAIAAESNGKHYFVAHASALPQVFSQEFDELATSVASDAEMLVELAPGVEVEEVFDRTFQRDGRKVRIPFGTFAAKQEKTALLRLRVADGARGNKEIATVRLGYHDFAEGRRGECEGTLGLAITDKASAQTELDPFVAARLSRSRTAQTLTDANKLFEAGRSEEAKKTLGRRADELKKDEAVAVAAARRLAPAAAPMAAAKPIDRDFADQLGAVNNASASFGKGGGPGAAPSRNEKAQVRSNQAEANAMHF
jgi:Ca-activated chloride channel family protein